MFDVNNIPSGERKRITNALLKWGINVNPQNGKIDYIVGSIIPEVKIQSIHLIRHAETIAATKHEFMSDTSQNCDFTDNGIEVMRQQAEQLDKFDFDIALYGPIERVVNAKNIIMSIQQRFEAIKVEMLCGINNSGWEYKSYCELENDPIFVAREVDLNIFARTPNGSSWGTVLANCADVLEYIGSNFAGKRVLLISQGSILRGLQILLRYREHPWDDYKACNMFCIGTDSHKKMNYGIIQKVL